AFDDQAYIMPVRRRKGSDTRSSFQPGKVYGTSDSDFAEDQLVQTLNPGVEIGVRLVGQRFPLQEVGVYLRKETVEGINIPPVPWIRRRNLVFVIRTNGREAAQIQWEWEFVPELAGG